MSGRGLRALLRALSRPLDVLYILLNFPMHRPETTALGRSHLDLRVGRFFFFRGGRFRGLFFFSSLQFRNTKKEQAGGRWERAERCEIVTKVNAEGFDSRSVTATRCRRARAEKSTNCKNLSSLSPITFCYSSSSAGPSLPFSLSSSPTSFDFSLFFCPLCLS